MSSSVLCYCKQSPPPTPSLSLRQTYRFPAIMQTPFNYTGKMNVFFLLLRPGVTSNNLKKSQDFTNKQRKIEYNLHTLFYKHSNNTK